MPPKKKPVNAKNGKEKKESTKRESVASEVKEDAVSVKSDESKSVDEYSEIGGAGSRRGSKYEQRKAGGPSTGMDSEEQELQDMKDRRQKLERTTIVLDRHDLVVQKLIMKAREDLVMYI